MIGVFMEDEVCPECGSVLYFVSPKSEMIANLHNIQVVTNKGEECLVDSKEMKHQLDHGDGWFCYLFECVACETFYELTVGPISLSKLDRGLS